MKLSLACFALVATAPLVFAVTEQKPVLISYPSDTPSSVIEEAKAAVLKAGGVITHEFNLIKGFAANAPAKILESIQAMEAHSGVLIEEDKVMRVSDS